MLVNFYRRLNMPRKDGTGPNGMGPMTGRGYGPCAGDDVPGYEYGRGRGGGFGYRGGGRGRGFGGGFGRGNRFFDRWLGGPMSSQPFVQPPDDARGFPEREEETLTQQVAYYEQALKALTKRLDELKSSRKPTPEE